MSFKEIIIMTKLSERGRTDAVLDALSEALSKLDRQREVRESYRRREHNIRLRALRGF